MNTISGQKYRQMLVAGANMLEKSKQMVNDMNVFPVPDGDTGTNMSLTVTSAVKEVLAVGSESVTDISKALSSGALRGARGNSGVILSQLFRGLYKGVKGSEVLTAALLAQAMQRGVETAYKAVQKPKEGTILTVAKEAALKAMEVAVVTDDVIEMMAEVVKAAETALENTPNLLPVLKEAGVVDSGGQGLLLIYRGYLEALRREDDTIDPVIALSESGEAAKEEEKKVSYCVELIVEVKDPETAKVAMEESLKSIGTGVIVMTEGRTIKLHVHTENPGAALAKATELGAVNFTKVENMEISHQHVLKLQDATKKKEPQKDVGFISVAAGKGLKNIFKELGVDYVISGGQTMNPSTEDILKAAGEVNAKEIYVLPNNKNIILAAQQAAAIIKEKVLHVISTKSIPQGIAAMIGYMPGESVETNTESMNESVSAVVSGAVTYAIRDTRMGEFEIKENDILALKSGDLCKVGRDLMETTSELLEEMITDETSILTIFYGEDASPEQAEALRAKVSEAYPGIEVEVQEGDQPIYYFLLSAE